MEKDEPLPAIPTSDSNKDNDDDDDKYFMKKALEVAERALEIGEVPVGCVLVLDKDHPFVAYKRQRHRQGKGIENEALTAEDRHGVIISHGANQVNATRDATRHAEIVAIDRVLTDGVSSDQLRLPIEESDSTSKQSPSSDSKKGKHSAHYGKRQWEDRWVNNQSNPGHWTNSFGWRNNFDDDEMDTESKSISNSLRTRDIFRHCQLYVTCEVSQTVRSSLLMFQIHVPTLDFSISTPAVHNVCCSSKYGKNWKSDIWL